VTVAQTFPDGLRIPQIVGALRIFEQRRVLLADQPGAGKTAQALVALELDDAFRRPGYTTLILCNVTGCQLTWSRELRERVGTQYNVVIADLLDTGGKRTLPSIEQRNARLAAAYFDAQERQLPFVVLANFDALRFPTKGGPKMRNLFSMRFDAVVIDEGHLVLPTKVDGGPKLTQFWRGLLALDIAPEAIRLSITGTPDRGKLYHRYGHWKFLMPSHYNNFWRWARQTFVITEQKWGGVEIGKVRQPQAWLDYDARHMIRRTKAEMLEGMPEKAWADGGGVDLPLTAAQEQAYFDYQESLQERRQELLEEAELLENPTEQDRARKRADALRLQFSLRARQMATCTWTVTETVGEDGRTHSTAKPIVAGPEHSNKLAWILQWLDERAYTPDGYDPSQGKVVLVSYFTEVLHWLQAELAAAGIASAVLAGDTPAPEKQRIEAEFQRGELRVVLLSGYLGVSINLDAADDMIFVDSVHDPDKMEQAEDRIHRASRFHHVTYWRLCSVDTIDMAILSEVDARYRETRKTYDGSRGVAFARLMLHRTAQPEGAAA